MTQVGKKIYNYYDNKFDTLTVMLSTTMPVYSEEIYNNIYIIYSEIDGSVVGIEILCFSKRSPIILERYVPSVFYNVVENYLQIVKNGALYKNDR